MKKSFYENQIDYHDKAHRAGLILIDCTLKSKWTQRTGVYLSKGTSPKVHICTIHTWLWMHKPKFRRPCRRHNGRRPEATSQPSDLSERNEPNRLHCRRNAMSSFPTNHASLIESSKLRCSLGFGVFETRRYSSRWREMKTWYSIDSILVRESCNRLLDGFRIWVAVWLLIRKRDWSFVCFTKNFAPAAYIVFRKKFFYSFNVRWTFLKYHVYYFKVLFWKMRDNQY